MNIRFDNGTSSRDLVQFLTAHEYIVKHSDTINEETFRKGSKFNSLLSKLFTNGVIVDGNHIFYEARHDCEEGADYLAEAEVYICSKVSTPTFKFVWSDPDEYPELEISSMAIFNQILDAAERELGV